MKAWIGRGDPDGDAGAVIVFADTAGRARSAAFASLHDYSVEWLDVRVTREPKYDGREASPPNARELMADGWTWGCFGCERQCTADDDPPAVWEGSRLYCASCATPKAAAGGSV